MLAHKQSKIRRCNDATSDAKNVHRNTTNRPKRYPLRVSSNRQAVTDEAIRDRSL